MAQLVPVNVLGGSWSLEDLGQAIRLHIAK
jgi:hypothetical protein